MALRLHSPRASPHLANGYMTHDGRLILKTRNVALMQDAVLGADGLVGHADFGRCHVRRRRATTDTGDASDGLIRLAFIQSMHKRLGTPKVARVTRTRRRVRL